jgi:hypothetical protein
VDDGPVSGRAATEARRNARATRKEERSNKAQKKERVEFLEVPAQGMGLEELAEKLAVNSADVIKALFMKGIMTTVNMVRQAHSGSARVATRVRARATFCRHCQGLFVLTRACVPLSPVGAQVLDKEKVLMVAEAFEVEVLEEDEVGVDVRTHARARARVLLRHVTHASVLSFCVLARCVADPAAHPPTPPSPALLSPGPGAQDDCVSR